MNQDNIAIKIKEIRVKHKLTQAQLGEKLGVTFQAVSKWENKVNIPDISILNQISILFDIDINELINGETKVKNTKKNYLIYICILLMITIMISMFYFYNDNDSVNVSMTLTPISTSSADFEIMGSLVMSDNVAVIHVSDIKYIGEKKDDVYVSLDFKLIEDNNNTLKVIDQLVINDNSKTLEDIVQKINFKVENYLSDCDTFNCNNLYIKVNATDETGQTITLEIPFITMDNCSCEN